MPLKTFLATVEVRVVVNVPTHFDAADFSDSLEFLNLKSLKVGKHVVDDVQILDVTADEHTDEDADR